MKRIARLLPLLVLIASCKKNNDKPSTPNYTVSTTYNFADFNDSNSVKLLLMIDQIGAKVNTGNTVPHTVVSAQVLKDMFNNVNGYFVDSSLKLNNSGLSLANFCSPAAKADLLNYFDSIGLYSQSTATASNGAAGVIASTVSTNKKFLLSPNGVWYYQVYRKTAHGGILQNSINHYLTDSLATGTNSAHYWDLAFGLLGVPVNFPTSTTGLKYLGSYSNQVDPGLGSNKKLMNAFLTGRAAIGAKDNATAQAQATIIIKTLDSLDAAAIVQEMKETDANIEAGDAVAAYGTLSETTGFIRNLKYNTSGTRVITDAQYTQLLALLDNTTPNTPNLYNFVNASVSTKQQIEAKTDAIRQFIGKTYGFSASQLAAQ
jgi:hypothetical protein